MMRSARSAIPAFLLVLTLAATAFAAPGDLDLGFGGFGADGRIQNLGFQAKSVAMDAQGRIVIAGNAGNAFHVQRRSGPRFATIEELTFEIDPAQTSAVARDVALAPDGKIVVVGTVKFGNEWDFAVARLKNDLTLDETFAGDGTTSLDFEGLLDEAHGVAVQDDHKIVVAGETFVDVDRLDDFGVARFQENGEPDPAFDGDGEAAIDSDEEVDVAYDLDLDLGKIYVAGSSAGNFSVVRLTSDGVRDGSFGDDGFAFADFGSDDSALAIDVRHGDVVLAGGNLDDPGAINVARFFSNGAPDNNFGGDGKVTTAVPGLATAYDVVVQADAKVVALARNFFDADPDVFLLVRYRVDGFVDTTFGDNGFVSTGFDSGEAGPDSLLLQPDGWLLAVGGPHAARYRSNGSLDAGGAVQVIFDPLQVSAQVGGLAVDSARRIVAAGHVAVGEESSDIALARFSSELDGTLDTTYGNGEPKLGVTVTGTGLDEQVHALALEGTKAVVAGQIGASPDINFLLGRYTDTGEPDGSCAVFGFNVQDFDGGDDVGRAVAFGDGKIFVAGTATGPTSDYGVAVFNSSDCTLNAQFGRERVDMGSTDTGAGVVVQVPRFPVTPFDTKAVLAGTTGTDIGLTRVEIEPVIGGLRDVDPGFGTNGKTVVPTGSSETVTVMARQSDGKLVVGGWSAGIDNADFFLARFSAGGILDTSFGVDGFAYADFGVNDNAHAIAVRADDTIALAGCNMDFGSRFALALFTPSGQLDTGFSDDGLLEIEIGGADCAHAVRFLKPRFLVVGGITDGGGTPSFGVALVESTQDPTATTTTTVTTTTVTTTSVTVSTTTTTLETTTTAPTSTTTLTVTTTTASTSSTTATSTTTTESTTSTTVPDEACGDPNDDGDITASDALFVLRAAVGSSTCAPCVCDTDASAAITAADALRVLRVAVGQSVPLQCPACV